ncbi:MAG: hypothetical protein ACI85O_001137 [Saprospiraceae bacterium]|jgi:hypothetical protein
MSLEAFKIEDVIAEENRVLTARRAQMKEKGLDAADAEKFAETKFGIALSGGGIRSATINLGFLKTLNIFNLLQKSDYLSTVSGGGYCGSYIQATLKQRGDYGQLFVKEDIDHMRSYGAYLIPGQSAVRKFWNTLILTVGYFTSLLMSLLSPALIIAAVIIFIRIMGQAFGFGEAEISEPILDIMPQTKNEGFISDYIIQKSLIGIVIVFFMHLFVNIFFKFKLGVSRIFNLAETTIALAILVVFSFLFLRGLRTAGIFEIDVINVIFDTPIEIGRIIANAILLFLMILAGFILNPNALSFHRFYRTQLAEAYLKRAGDYDNIPLHKIFNPEGKDLRDWLNPYPLINTCLNLQSPGGGEAFKGSKANDYFVLSPLYCGAKLVDYVKTDKFPGYNEMTLPAATTISAAAINPGMGNYSNKVLSVFMTLFNARLGFWVNNPMKRFTQQTYRVWWPLYFFYELFSKINTDNSKLNISDGGHIENLGVYELLRRKCRLIIAVDAGADPKGTFGDLNNLTIRARNELGIAIQFREQPEDFLTPRPSHGYAQKRFVTADLYKIWEEFEVHDNEGNPFTYFKVDEDGSSKNKKIEALVNYSLDADEKVLYQVDLKIHSDGKISDAVRAAAIKAAKRTVRRNLSRSRATGKDVIKIGTLVYVKSTVLAPKGKPFIPRDTKENKLLFDTYKYKIYHPDFPHEPTSDQFFDPVQWEAYYRLGQYMAAAVLGCKNSDMQKFMNCKDGIGTPDQCKEPPAFSIEDLLGKFDNGKPLAFDPAVEVPEVEMILQPRSLDQVEMEESAISEESTVDYTLEGKTHSKEEEKASTTPPPPTAIPDAGDEVDYEM